MYELNSLSPSREKVVADWKVPADCEPSKLIATEDLSFAWIWIRLRHMSTGCPLTISLTFGITLGLGVRRRFLPFDLRL